MPVPDGSADTVSCLNAFFFPEPEKSLCEMVRTLKAGGMRVLVTSQPTFEARIARFSRSMAESMRFDAPETLPRWARDVGLHPVETAQLPNAGILFIARRKA